MPAVRQYSDMVREYLEPRLCEADVVYKVSELGHPDNIPWTVRFTQAPISLGTWEKVSSLCSKSLHFEHVVH
jgi:hypothetical protein